MVHGGVKLLFRGLGAVALGALLTSGFVVWRLGQGPVQLNWLTPYLEEALSAPQAGVRLRIGSTEIAWENAERVLDLRVRDASVVDGSGGVLARFSKLGLSLEPAPLLAGRIRPRAIDIFEPHLRLIRETDGTLRLGLQTSPAPVAPAGTEAAAPQPATPQPVAPFPSADDPVPGSSQPLDLLFEALNTGDTVAGRLQSVALTDADVEVIDRLNGVVWDIPALSLDVEREATGLAVTAEARLDLDARPTTVLLAGQFRNASRTLSLNVDVDGLRPAALAPLHRDLRPLSTVDFPLSGRVRLAATLEQTTPVVHRVEVDLTGGAGMLRAPAPVNTDYPLLSLRLRGSYDLDRSKVALDDLSVVLDSATVTGTASLAPAEGGAMAGTATVSVGPMTVETLKRYWPIPVAPNPREWVVANLKDGRVTGGSWTVSLGGPDLADVTVTGLEGKAHAEAVTVSYLSPMPLATDARADLNFGMDRVELLALQGQVGALKITDGAIRFTDLDKYDNFADIQLAVEGPLLDALKLLDSPPLGYPRKLGLDPTKARGETATTLSLQFPLLQNLALEDLKVRADAKVRNGILKGAVFGQDLTEGDIALGVDTTALDAKGKARIGGVPMDFTWRENFSGKPFASRYTATAQVAEDKRGMFGLTFPPFTPTYIGGPATAALVYTVNRNRTSVLDVQADLADSRLWIPGFEYEKPPGKPAQATAQVLLKGDQITDVPKFHVSADGLELEGAVALTAGQDLQSVTVSSGKIGDTVLSGTLTRMKDRNGFEVDARGPFLDATPFLGTRTVEGAAPKTPAPLPEVAADGSIDDGLPPLVLRGFFDTVKTSEDVRTGKIGLVTALQASANRSGGRWQTARIDATVAEGGPVSFILGPDPEGKARRRFTARTEDAGALLRALDVLGTLRGGKLWAEGYVNARGVAEGTLSIDGYRLVDAPILAKLLSVAALTGILDALTGDGISFDRLEAPFVYDSDREHVQFRQFRTFGSSLGLTGSGSMDFRTNRIDGTGTMVPFFMVNSLVGRIPLLGDLLTGFEKDGGLFAAGYTVRGAVSDPDISVNPLSALAPGFLRKLFTFDFGSSSSDPVTEAPSPEVPLSPPSHGSGG